MNVYIYIANKIILWDGRIRTPVDGLSNHPLLYSASELPRPSGAGCHPFQKGNPELGHHK